jgi:aminoglycoside phosphotransferase family enzyme
MPDGPSPSPYCAVYTAGPVFEDDIGRKIGFLSRPDSYHALLDRVEVVETHFSWVFLTDTQAFKLKKPVKGNGFDFRDVEARRRNALAELRLNRRLAADVYLGVVSLNLSVDGSLVIGGVGKPVDWLVKMVRLEADRMFDRCVIRRDWHYAELEALAQRLAGFFATARRVRLSAPQLKGCIREELRATLAALSAACETRSLTAVKLVVRRLDSFLFRHAALFRQRIREGRLVDGHGDLRPEHVYLKGTPRIIDCLEFRAELRRHDPVDELAYLALECRRLGGPAIEGLLLRRYRENTGDTPPPVLARFYTAFNALVRARIAIDHLLEPGARTPDEWVNRATAYLAIAAKESQLL